MKMTEELAREISNEMLKALEPVAEKYDIDFKANKISWNLGSITCNIEGFALSADVESARQAEFIQYCEKFGIPKETFGKKVSINGAVYLVVGIKPRARKYPLLVQDLSIENGKLYAVPSEYAFNIVE